MGNAPSNSLFNLDTNDLIFPNLSTLIKQEDNSTDMGFGLGGGSTMTSQNLSNATTLLHQLMEANNAEPSVEQMDLNDTSLIEGMYFYYVKRHCEMCLNVCRVNKPFKHHGDKNVSMFFTL